eukprot:364488-Chlamydomonas_euryale.AAC.5
MWGAYSTRLCLVAAMRDTRWQWCMHTQQGPCVRGCHTVRACHACSLVGAAPICTRGGRGGKGVVLGGVLAVEGLCRRFPSSANQLDRVEAV